MFSDTGNLSFVIGITFILMSLCGIFVIYLIIKNRSIENENIDKIIELGKWFMVSVAIAFSVSIINDAFRERDQDIKELESFAKYTEIILDVAGPEKRQLLSEYFATVSPSGPIRKSWEAYKTIVDKQSEEYKKSKERDEEIERRIAEGKATSQEIAEKKQLEAKISLLNQSLMPKPDQANLKPRVYFHIRDEIQRTPAKQLADTLESSANVVVPGVRRVGTGPSETELRYFKSEERQEAEQIANDLTSLGLKVETKYVPGFESSNKIRPRHYELWISSGGL
jgi:hypothetical protein